MDNPRRFDVMIEKHIGVGIRWESVFYPLHLSVALPFVTFTIGIGRALRLEED